MFVVLFFSLIFKYSVQHIFLKNKVEISILCGQKARQFSQQYTETSMDTHQTTELCGKQQRNWMQTYMHTTNK